MRGLTRRWLFESAAPPPEAPSNPSPTDPPSLVERVLRARGWTDAAEIAAFCDPRLTHLHDPSLIPDLDRAAARILDALRSREPLVIYGDYDVDGVAASAILHHLCLALEPDADIRIYIPHRIDEGYGLSSAALLELAAEGARVVVSVDCGVTAVAPAADARGAGLDLIITDHHNPPATLADLPPAFAVVHPRRPDSRYPFEHLSGAGVAFKLAWRLATLAAGSDRVPPAHRELLLDLLALAALGTIADVVPLIGENRVIARFGLSRIRTAAFEGLQALITAAGLDGDRISEEHVGFALAPRLNACGRLGHAREAVELLTTATGGRAREIATALTRLNDERRTVEKAIFEQACDMAEQLGMTRDDRRAIVLAHPDWHAGVIGIVCSRLVDRFGRPAVLLQIREGQCHGSCRSVPGLSIHAALAACARHLDHFGGHDMAAGLRVSEANLPAFVEDFTQFVNARLPVEHLMPALRIDCDADLAELTPDAVRRLGQLGPFGQGNPAPALRLLRVRVTSPPEPLGAHARHLAMRVRQGAREMRVVGWGWGERRSAIAGGDTIDVVVRPKINAWNGRASVEGEMLDVRVGDA